MKSSKTDETIENRGDNNVDVLSNSLGSTLISTGAGNLIDVIGGQANSVSLAGNDSMLIDYGFREKISISRTRDIAEIGWWQWLEHPSFTAFG
ncbi:hypothetical protein J8I87_42265 [Paraburkholderia sp. LEh10]|uniref:hypothetical protein n=1 Tax=Paraburkholderia sp. LEh10 TaxID=2821353 RepID=UPI001AE88496|nr:hypothetical protein [Paraburkholderia sp. LEh10]MBP0596119.1 hypothetical protein [Paraburkholderia sp. LEh10]